jgi:uncharacterized protein (TIGR03435 family)
MQLRLMQLLLIAILGVPAVEAQTPAFEVASVKPSRLVDTSWSLGCGNPVGRGGVPPGRCQAANASLLRILALAYNLPTFTVETVGQYISGGPSWIRSDRFNIDAKAAEASASESELRFMLQNLLADRFKLKIHEESKEISGYALVVAKGGPKLKSLGSRPPSVRPIPLAIGASNIVSLVRGLSVRLAAPVEDKTGITGDYDFNVTLESITGNDAPSLFTIIKEQFGLTLESQKVPIKVYVIDQVERPTEN